MGRAAAYTFGGCGDRTDDCGTAHPDCGGRVLCRRQPRDVSHIARRRGRRPGRKRSRCARSPGQGERLDGAVLDVNLQGKPSLPRRRRARRAQRSVRPGHGICAGSDPRAHNAAPRAPSRFGPPNSSGCCFGEAAAPPAANRIFVYKQRHGSRRDSHSRRRPWPEKHGLGCDRGLRIASELSSPAGRSARTHRLRSPSAWRRSTAD